MMRFLKTALGVVVGYFVMVVLITLVQETWLGGVGWGETPIGVLAAAGLLTAASAFVGAVIATAISHPVGRVAAWSMSGLVVLETSVLLFTGKLSGPLWFDLVAAMSLVVALLLGGEAYLRYRGTERR